MKRNYRDILSKQDRIRILNKDKRTYWAFYIREENVWHFQSQTKCHWLPIKLVEQLNNYKYIGYDGHMRPLFTNDISVLEKKYQRKYKIKKMLGEEKNDNISINK